MKSILILIQCFYLFCEIDSLVPDIRYYKEQIGACRRLEDLGDTSVLPAFFEQSALCSAYKPSEWMTEKQYAWFKSLAAGSVKNVKKHIRKEVRQMTRQDWKNYVTAITAMKDSVIDYVYESKNNVTGGFTEYHLFSKIHQQKYAPASTKFGPAFFPWHREFLFRFERALQSHVPDAFLPYWDVTLDTPLWKPGDSVLFSDEFFGTAYGVLTGDFAGWKTIAIPPGSKICFPNTRAPNAIELSGMIYRACSNTDMGYNWDELQEAVFSLKSYAQLSQKQCLVSDHDLLHNFISGTTEGTDAGCSVTDPVTWPMHNMLDFLFYKFMEKNRNKAGVLDYPETNLSCHAADAIMEPFDMKNIDGLSTRYTDYFYSYDEIPHSCQTGSDCGSEYAWCNFDSKTCTSKVKLGGNCGTLCGFGNADICYGNNTYCINSYCTYDENFV